MSDRLKIRPMTEEDRSEVLAMMRIFYDSPAVFHTSSDRVLTKDFNDCVGDMPLLKGYIAEYDGAVAGYAMVSLGYTTEYGGLCIWVEDLYIKPDHRRKNIGNSMLEFIEKEFPDAVRFKLEVECENDAAASCYKKSGYSVSVYDVMTKETDPDK